MTSWPWMKGIEVAISDPIDPVCPEDIRPSVKELIQKHGDKISKIKAGIIDHPEYDENKHDELWILRFWMSHKKSKAAIDAAKRTLDFRAEHKLDENDIRSIPPHYLKEGKVYEFFSRMGEGTVILTHPHKQRGVLAFIKPSSMNQHKLVEELTEDYWLPFFSYVTEWIHQWLDYVTRTTGRLTRSIRIINPEGMKMSLVCRECLRRHGKAVGTMEDFYPQLLESLYICNPPTLIKAVWTIIKTVAPKRVQEKIDMINPLEKEHERKHLYRHISEEDLPDKYGGKNTVPEDQWDPMT